MAGRVRTKKGAAPPHAQEQGVAASGQHGASAAVLLQGTDTALKLLQDIRAHRMDPRDLTAMQRRACLMLLANGTQTSAELAAMFKTSPSTIRMDLKQIRDEVGREVRDWSLSEVVGQLALTAEKCTAHAMKNEDPGLAWTVQRDFAKLLKELGVLKVEQQTSGFRMIIEDIGSGYERARQALTLALNPTLTGEVIDVKAGPVRELELRGPITGSAEDGDAGDDEHAVPQTHDHDTMHVDREAASNTGPRAAFGFE